HGAPRAIPALLRLRDQADARPGPLGTPRVRTRGRGPRAARTGLAAPDGTAPGLPMESLRRVAARSLVSRRASHPRRPRLCLLPSARRRSRALPAPARTPPCAADVQASDGPPAHEVPSHAADVAEDPRCV